MKIPGHRFDKMPPWEVMRLDNGITMVILDNMKTAISIPDNLFLAAERLAGRLGISRSELFQKAMRSFLDQHGSEGVTEKLNAVYSPGGRDGKLDPVLERLQGASLAAEDWE
jgi:hypothetical protein